MKSFISCLFAALFFASSVVAGTITIPFPISGAGVNVTWDPVNKGTNVVLSNGNLDASVSTGGFNVARSSIGKTSGKCYAEITVTASTATNLVLGFVNASASLTTYIGNSNNGRGGQNNGSSYASGWTAGTGNGSYGNVTIGLAFDLATGNGFFAISNVWQGGSDPVTQASPWVTGLSATVYIGGSMSGVGNTVRLSTRTSQFTYSPPSGYTQFATC